jgi:hypothetical protein
LNDENINSTISNFIQGQPLGQVKAYSPEDAFEMNSIVELESNNDTWSLLFDGTTQDNSLYEAKIQLWF